MVRRCTWCCACAAAAARIPRWCAHPTHSRSGRGAAQPSRQRAARRRRRRRRCRSSRSRWQSPGARTARALTWRSTRCACGRMDASDGFALRVEALPRCARAARALARRRHGGGWAYRADRTAPLGERVVSVKAAFEPAAPLPEAARLRVGVCACACGRAAAGFECSDRRANMASNGLVCAARAKRR
jgi:hypothetical protein